MGGSAQGLPCPCHIHSDSTNVGFFTISVSVSVVSYHNFKRLQDETGLKVWYAFFEINNDFNLEPKCYIIPLSTAKRFEFDVHRTGTFPFMQMPFECLSLADDKINIENPCIGCDRKTCKEAEAALKGR